MKSIWVILEPQSHFEIWAIVELTTVQYVHRVFEYRTDSNTLFLAWNDQTLNFEH